MAQLKKETPITGAFVRQPNRFTARPEPEPGHYRHGLVTQTQVWPHPASDGWGLA
jgi:putative glutathione S-transferase